MYIPNPDDDKSKINGYGAKTEKKLHLMLKRSWLAGNEHWRYHTEKPGGRYNEQSSDRHSSSFKTRMNGDYHDYDDE